MVGLAVVGAALVMLAGAAVIVAPAAYAGEGGEAPAPAQTLVDDNDDTRVEVQLMVAGIAAFTVVGVGMTAYMLRRRLGLIAPPPEAGSGGHH